MKWIYNILLLVIIILTLVCLNNNIIDYNQHLYDTKSYNCVDFTIDSLNKLHMIGIPSYQVYGIYKSNSNIGHSWVGIDIFGYILHFEPQTLSFFNPNECFQNISVNYGSIHRTYYG